jgi:hypothetical protein
MTSERDTQFAGEVPAFVAEIQSIFTAAEIRNYLDHLERRKYLAPPDRQIWRSMIWTTKSKMRPGRRIPWWALKSSFDFSRVRQLLQPEL